MPKKYSNKYTEVVKEVKKTLPNKIDDEYIDTKLLVSKQSGGAYFKERVWFLCGQDLSKIDTSELSKEKLSITNFDSNTKFSKEQEKKYNPKELLKRGKVFGLGLDKLHKAGIDGTGINSAVIDWSFDTNNEEFIDEKGKNKITYYDEEHTPDFFRYDDFFHGKAVTALLCGNTTGVAPNSNISYYAIGPGDHLTAKKKILEKILEKNHNEKTKLDLISMSSSLETNENNEEYTNKLREQRMRIYKLR